MHVRTVIEPQMAYLGPVEDARLIHVVPRVERERRLLVLVQRVLLRPPVAHLRAEHVQIRTGPRPAPALKVAAVLVLNIVPATGKEELHS